MKAQNIQSNTSAPFLAGSMFGKFHNEQSTLLTVRLLDDAKKIYTENDLKDYVVGYREALTISDASRQAMASMVRTILKVATGLDAKLCEYHKVKTPAAGQKVVKAKMDKGAKGIDSLAKALRIPAAPKVSDSDGESDAEPTAKNAPSLEAELKAFVKKQHDNGYTNLDIGNAMAALSIELCRA